MCMNMLIVIICTPVFVFIYLIFENEINAAICKYNKIKCYIQFLNY